MRSSWIDLLSRLGEAFFITFLHIGGVNSQITSPCTHLFRYEARAAFDRNDHATAIKYFDRFTEEGGILTARDLLELSRSKLQIGDSIACIELLKSGLRKGLIWSEPGNYLSILDFFDTDQQAWLQTIQIDPDQHRKIFLDRLHKPLLVKIKELHDQDQKVRLQSAGLSNDEHRRLIHSTDSITLTELMKIFNEYDGFPPYSLIDRETNFKLLLLMHHTYRTFPEEFDHFRSVIVKAINAFQIPPNEYAVMMDRHQYMIDRCSIYGEVPYSDSENRSSIDNIKDLAQVDRSRYAIGLPSLRQHAIERGFALPDGYIELRSPCEME